MFSDRFAANKMDVDRGHRCQKFRESRHGTKRKRSVSEKRTESSRGGRSRERSRSVWRRESSRGGRRRERSRSGRKKESSRGGRSRERSRSGRRKEGCWSWSTGHEHAESRTKYLRPANVFKCNIKNTSLRGKDINEIRVEKRDEDIPIHIAEPSNKGFAIMAKMGYKAGEGLGKYTTGRVEPVSVEIKDDRRGLGHETALKEIAKQTVGSPSNPEVIDLVDAKEKVFHRRREHGKGNPLKQFAKQIVDSTSKPEVIDLVDTKKEGEVPRGRSGHGEERALTQRAKQTVGSPSNPEVIDLVDIEE